jgi:hypothetical protein
LGTALNKNEIHHVLNKRIKYIQFFHNSDPPPPKKKKLPEVHRIYGTVDFPVLCLYKCLHILSPCEESMFENSMLKKISGFKMDEVSGKFIKLHTEKLC